MLRFLLSGCSRLCDRSSLLIVISLFASGAHAVAPEPYVEGDILTLPVLVILDEPYTVQFQIVDTIGVPELLLHSYAAAPNADIVMAPTYDGELLNIPHLAIGQDSYWGEFSLTHTQPVLFRLEAAEKNLPGSSGVQGKWRIFEITDAQACGEGTLTDTYDLRVRSGGLAGNSILYITTPLGEFEAVISGRSLAWSGSYAEDGGILNNDIDVTFSSELNTLEGTSAWTYSENGVSCSGSSTFIGALLHN